MKNSTYDPDYGLCAQDCTKCEFSWKDGCGLDYNGMPRTTFREAMILLTVILMSVIIALILISSMECFK